MDLPLIADLISTALGSAASLMAMGELQKKCPELRELCRNWDAARSAIHR
jgi:hypothetical protein